MKSESVSHLQLRSTLCDPIDCIPPDFSVHGVPQARILEWAAISFSGDLPDPGIEPESLRSPALAGSFFTTSATWEVTSHYKNCVCNEDLCNTKKPFVSHFCGSPDTFIGLHF